MKIYLKFRSCIDKLQQIKIMIINMITLKIEPQMINSLFVSDTKINIVEVHSHIHIIKIKETDPKNLSLISF